MPNFVWAALATSALTLTAAVVHLIPLWFGLTAAMPLPPLGLFSDVAAMLLLSFGIVFMFWLWQTPSKT